MMEKLLCNVKSTIKDAMMLIDKNERGTVFVVDDNKILKGVLTDGDIRRALLNNKTLDTCIKDIIKNDFTFASINANEREILESMDQRVRVLPLVNEKMQVIDYGETKRAVRLPISEPILEGRELEYVVDAVSSTWISSIGKYIGKFESKFSQYCGVKNGVATSSGTAALHLALLALKIGEGDEVIVPDITFAATINAVLYTGATPVIVDIEEDSWCIDSKEIEKAISKRTKAIIPVHVYGQPCDMDSIIQIAKEHNLYVIEDCAEAHGAEYGGKKVGSFGDIACFSFFGNKVITTGEGGMCITNNEKLADRMRLFRDHGMSKHKKYYHEVIGYNYRLTNVQAAIGVAQLENIDTILAKRAEVEQLYIQEIKQNEDISFQRNNLSKRKKITWLVTVYAKDEKTRDFYLKKMLEKNIDVRPFFIPLSQMDIYRKYSFSNRNSCRISKLGFNLPTSSKMKKSDVMNVVEVFKEKSY